MASPDDAAALAAGMPEAVESLSYGRRAWKVRGKQFAWERPFSKADLKRFGDEPVPEGPIFAVTVDDLAEKEAVLAAGHVGVFTISHFDGYPSVLLQLSAVEEPTLRDLIVDAWLAVAPPTLATAYLAEHPLREQPRRDRPNTEGPSR